jgi:hypothetical protein
MEGVWRCTCLGKVVQRRVSQQRLTKAQGGKVGILKGMMGGSNMECTQELLVSNACRMVCLGNECKPSLERGLFHQRGVP